MSSLWTHYLFQFHIQHNHRSLHGNILSKWRLKVLSWLFRFRTNRFYMTTYIITLHHMVHIKKITESIWQKFLRKLLLIRCSKWFSKLSSASICVPRLNSHSIAVPAKAVKMLSAANLPVVWQIRTWLWSGRLESLKLSSQNLQYSRRIPNK